MCVDEATSTNETNFSSLTGIENPFLPFSFHFCFLFKNKNSIQQAFSLFYIVNNSIQQLNKNNNHRTVEKKKEKETQPLDYMFDEVALGSFAVRVHALLLRSNNFLISKPFSSLNLPQNLLSFVIIALLIGYHYLAAEPRQRRE